MHSSQRGPHLRLAETVRRHRHASWAAPIHAGSRTAFETFLRWRQRDRPLVLDAGCGTAASTATLARRHPGAQVVGVDRSAHRLSRAPCPPMANELRLRARLEDVWRLLLESGDRPVRHYLLYPNPWPKPGHLKRRWHAHPVWPVVVALGGTLTLRTNWAIYAEECRRTLQLHGLAVPPVVSFGTDTALTPFERKYSRSGHDLFDLTLRLDSPRGRHEANRT
ncbi:methyltransferase domain-containing protein [Halomonas denitrificans]|nr:methyltransferase domain-containing protein [Halomonas denitrificans]